MTFFNVLGVELLGGDRSFYHPD